MRNRPRTRNFNRHLLQASQLAIAFSLAGSAHAQLVNSTWNTGNGNWNVAGNWSPTTSPNNGGGFTFNVLIGPNNPGAQVTFVSPSGTSASISTLTISNNADLFTNGQQLNVLGQTIIDGVGTTIRVDPHNTPTTVSFATPDLRLNNGGGLTMAGGTAAFSTQLEINLGSVVGGYGRINLGDADGVVEQSFENSALLQVQGNTAAPQTLTLHTNGVDTIDLDGDTELGVVDVSNALANVNADTCTLVIDGPLTDAFGGLAGAALQIGQRDTLTFNQDFQITTGAAIVLTGGTQTATMNGAGAITSIAGATFTATNNAVIANDMTFTGTANVVSVAASSTLTLNGTVTIPDASMIAFAASSSSLVIGGSTNITELAGDFNWDGPGTAATTVNGTGALTVNVNRVDTGDDTFGGTLNLDDDADVSVNTAANSWTMAGFLNKRNAGSSVVAGDTMTVTGAIDVSAGALTTPVTVFSSTSNTTVDGLLVAGSGSTFAGGAFSGSGTLRMASTSTASVNTTINVATFDWDGTSAGSAHTINSGVVFTINSTTFDSDGDMDDPVLLAGNGAAVNVNGVSQWTMNGAFNSNAAASGTANIGGSARAIFAGSLNVLGNTKSTAPLTFGLASTTTISAAAGLRLANASLATVNAMAGGVINGPGTLQADNNTSLEGFGTINAPIDFDNTSRVRANDGVLTINGSIVDVEVIGTADADGVLNVPNAWNNSVATGVALLGGIVQGGAITNDSVGGIQGFGTVTSRVVNNTQLLSFNGGSLIFQTAGNDTDWDGTTNAGLLRASNGTTLEIRDNATFGFTGTVQANPGGHVYVSGFGLDFNPGSTINLGAGTYQCTSSTDIGGTVSISAGSASTIDIANNFFLTFEPTSNTTLNGDLRLVNNNINIEAGATFSGGGAVIIPNGSHLVIDHTANVNALLVNEGALRPGNFEGIGRSDIKDYQQTDSGDLFIELTGTNLNQFDRLAITGIAQLDGYLNLDIDGGFVPSLGNTFNIISAPGGVFGTFDYKDVSGMPAGLAFHVAYMPTFVQLQVVNKPIFSADFDEDGDVDLTDLAIWKGAFQLNQLGDADGDNDSDYLDWVLWRAQLGGQPGPLPGPTVIPEPGVFGAILGVFGLAGLRRRARKTVKRGALAILAGVLGLGAFTGESSAVPTVSVLNNGTLGGNRNWIVQVTPDATLIAGGHGALAVELAIEVEGTQLLSGTINTSAWPYPLPSNSTFGGGASTLGVNANQATDTVFFTLGSNIFVSATPVTVGTITTSGTGRGVLCWGAQTLNQIGGGTGCLVVQGPTAFKGIRGTLPVGSIEGDADVDGKVNTVDFNLLAGHFSQLNMDWGDGDFNQDNTVNSADFNLLAGNYGKSIPAPAPELGSVVPEPLSLSPVIIATALARRYRR